MRQLIRVFDDIDREDLTVANAESCCLEHTIWIKAYIPGQAVNSCGSQQGGRSRGLSLSGNEETQCTFQAADDFSERQHLAAAVAMYLDIAREQRRKRGDIAVTRSSKKSARNSI